MALIFSFSPASAEDTLPGGRGGNLVVREGSVDILKENLDIRLHLGFAEVFQEFSIKNGAKAQKVVLGFPYRLGRSDQGLNNILIKVDGTAVEADSTKEADGENFVYWKLFTVEFMPDQTRTIELSHWQLNSANLRGLRAFNYVLKNSSLLKIADFNLNLSLMDGVYLENFDRTKNLDLDLRLEPLGWEQSQNNLSWQWQNFVPSFDINANFYWPGGDLAKTADLAQGLGLYQPVPSSNLDQANAISDSSYITAWGEGGAGPGIGETINFSFPGRTISEFRIIPGLATSSEAFKNASRPKEIKLNFSDGTERLITLADSMTMQYFPLDKPVSANHLKITLNSVYAGLLQPDDTFISEVELGTNLDLTASKASEAPAKQAPAWQRFFTDLWHKILNWFKKVF